MKRKWLLIAAAALLVGVILIVVLIFLLGRGPTSWDGEWEATWGYHDGAGEEVELWLSLTQDEQGNVMGAYIYGSTEGAISGVTDGRRLRGVWEERRISGWFEFIMNRRGDSFTGVWSHGDDEHEDGYWNGTRYSDQKGRPY